MNAILEKLRMWNRFILKLFQFQIKFYLKFFFLFVIE